jgi:hypothetical protein
MVMKMIKAFMVSITTYNKTTHIRTPPKYCLYYFIWKNQKLISFVGAAIASISLEEVWGTITQ